jgi:hypothetical protein
MREDQLDDSMLFRDARILVRQAVHALAEATTQKARSAELVSFSRERLVWSDVIIGESLLLRDRLRDAVSGIAGLERAKGVPPEQVLQLLKSLVIDAHAGGLQVGEAQSLTDDIVRWGIEAYYAA